MQPRTRKLISWALLATLALAAIGSVVSGGALVLERRGLLTLRRVPSPIILEWMDENWPTVAIVNTGTTPGSLLLEYVINTSPPDSGLRTFGPLIPERRPQPPRDAAQERIWVPSRSIVLRTHPRLQRDDCTVVISGRSGAGDSTFFYRHRGRRAVPRGTRVSLEWAMYGDTDRDTTPTRFYIGECYCKRAGIHVVEQPSVAFVQTQGEWDWYRWDGKTPVAIEVDTTTPPEIRAVEVVACDDRSSVGTSQLWAYPPDMTVIDQRIALEASK